MKKLILSLSLLAGGVQLGNAQNSVQINLNDGLCLDEITFEYLGGGHELHILGCEGTFNFDIGANELTGFTINGVFSPVNKTTEVMVNGAMPASSKVISVANSIIDDLNGLIR